MLQILGIRTFIADDGKEKKYDAFYDKNWRAPSVAVLLKDIEKYVEAIPVKDRWNIFYTVANCGDGKRKFESQSVLPFDFDGIDTARIDEYIKEICEFLKLDKDTTGLVFSGNGLHVLIGLKKKITKADYFKKNRHHYKAVADQINKHLKEKGLTGKTDTSVFDHRRILRLPNTENRKPDKATKTAKVLNAKITPVDFDITKISGLPDVPDSEQISKDYIRRYPRTDNEAVLTGCEFLKFCKEKPAEVTEPQWYAMLSVVARLEDGQKLCHEYSEGHHLYSQEETEVKIEQAVEASGPRACENINSIWSGCRDCENFERVKSPILLRGEDHIPTEYTGFHFIPITANGGLGKPVPCYEDLRKFFEREYTYKGLGGSRMVHVWNGKHYEYMENAFIEQFAQEHFDPAANNTKVSEFKSLVMRTNLAQLSWFQDTTRKKMNFLNGTLDIETFDFLPHDKEVGFRYVLPYNYEPSAKAPRFEAMLAKLTCGDKAMAQVLLEYMGYALSNDDCWTQKALLMVGEGSNGKSTLVNILKELAGKGNYSSLTIDDLNRSEYNRQIFEGKLFNFSEETPTKALMDNSLFKTLVTGGEVQVRSPYKEPYFIQNNAKLIFSCNALPSAVDTSWGFYRRLIIVPFNATFAQTDKDFDPHIEAKIKKELAGIFNLCMEAYKRLLRTQKFTECQVISDTLEKYIYSTDTVRGWKIDNLKLYPLEDTENESFVPTEDLYMAYKSEMINHNEKPVPYMTFSKKLAYLITDYEKRSVRKRVEVGTTISRVRGLKNVRYGEGITHLSSEDLARLTIVSAGG